MRSCNIRLTYVFHSRQSIYLLIPKWSSKVFSSIENLFLQNDTMSIKFETHLFAASLAIWKRNTQFKIQMQWNESEYKLKMLQTQYKCMNHLILLWETASVRLDHGEFFICVVAHSVKLTKLQAGQQRNCGAYQLLCPPCLIANMYLWFFFQQ